MTTPRALRLLAAIAVTAVMLGGVSPASASGSSDLIGQSGGSYTDGVHATLRTPDWYPQLGAGDYLYSWVMMNGYWGSGCRYWVQIGWMASGGSVYAAEQAWVEPTCPGGWTTYHTYQAFALGTDHRFEILNYGGNNWQVTVDNVIVDRVNLPSGPTARPSAYAETNGLIAMPDLTFYGIEVHAYGTWGQYGGCSYQQDPSFVFAAQHPCDYFVARH